MISEFLSNTGLSVTRLHTLVQLADAGSMTKAANGDAGQQSRISHQIKELEGFFGFRLTERAGKSARVNAKGQELASIARNHFSSLENFRRSLQTTDREWRVGAGDSLLQWLLIPAVGRSGKAKRYLMHNLRTEDVAARIQDERLDFGLIRTDAVRDLQASSDVCRITYAIVVPRRLVKRNLTIKAALSDLPHAAMAAEGQLAERLRRVASDRGGAYRAHLRCDSLGQCLAAVKSGGYAAVLPAHIISEETAGAVEIIEADLEELNRPISLIWSQRALAMIGPTAVGQKDELLQNLREEALKRGIREEVIKSR